MTDSDPQTAAPRRSDAPKDDPLDGEISDAVVGGPAAAPLTGLRILEFSAQGPVPHAAAVLSAWGADVISIQRPDDAPRPFAPDMRHRTAGRRLIRLDLKLDESARLCRRLARHADVLIEGYRPGVMERLDLGPHACMADNPKLVYLRLTGWGQRGHLAEHAGHDINYLALTGVLSQLRRPGDRPMPPLNLLADMGGGSFYAIAATLAALWRRSRSGRGALLDLSMVDGVNALALGVWDRIREGDWVEEPGANVLDGGAPFYDTYGCRDGGYVALGALEPKFFARFVELLGWPSDIAARQYDRAFWPELRRRLESEFLKRTRQEWTEFAASEDVCLSPVLTWREVPDHPHSIARQAFYRTPDSTSGPRLWPGVEGTVSDSVDDTRGTLSEPLWLSPDEVEMTWPNDDRKG